MKVLYLTNIPSPYRVDFFNEFGKLCRLTVVYEGHVATDRDEKWKHDEHINYDAIYLKGIRTSADSFFCLDILKFVSRKWDVIIIGCYATPTAMLFIDCLRLMNIPFILQTDGGFIKKDNYIKKAIKRHYISSASYWLTTGKMATEYFCSYGAQRDKCYEYPFTSIRQCDVVLEYDGIERKNVKKSLNMDDGIVILSVGQFIHRKGFDVLIKAMKNVHKSASLYIVGGIPTDEYIDLKEKLQLTNVNFIGFKSKEELAKYYFSADLFVLPTRTDIWGLVINEAMAFGLPVITTNMCIAGVELIENGVNGYVINVDDHMELATHINMLVEDDILRKEMSANNLRKISDYTIENMARKHMEILEKICG